MKKLLLLLAGVALASSLISCQSTGGHSHHHGSGYHKHDPLPSGVRYHQERMRRH